jgi:hypothetical protein
VIEWVKGAREGYDFEFRLQLGSDSLNDNLILMKPLKGHSGYFD